MMGALAELLGREKPVLWLDSHAYASRLLANDKAPWLDVTAFVAWQRKAMGLLRPDVTPLPLAPAIAAWLESHPELRSAMAAKSRTTFPLKTLLADEALRAHLIELTRGLHAGVGGVLALVMPSPRAWVVLAYQQAHGQADGRPLDVGEDEVDSASMLIADFLRAFGEAGVDVLLLQESAENEPASVEELRWYQSVFNVASHYRWDTGLQLPTGGPSAEPGAGEDPGVAVELAFVIAPRTFTGTPTGIVLGNDFWDRAPAPACPAGGFRYVEIPADAQPEAVLDRLATLR